MNVIQPEAFLPPCSIESEQSVIGGLMLDAGAWDKIAGVVKPEDFYTQGHREIMKAVMRLADANKQIDVLTVFEELERSGVDNLTGGLPYLGELASTCPGAANIVRYAEIVRDRATLRELQAAATDVHEIAIAADGGTTPERVNRAAERIARVLETGIRTKSEPLPVSVALAALMESMDKAADGSYRKHKTGLADLDKKLYDFVPGALVIIAGRPGMGKSALALQIVRQVAADTQPGAVFVATLEMPASQYMARMVAHKARMPISSILEPVGMSQADWGIVSDAIGALNTLPIYIDETPAISVRDLKARCNLKRRMYGGIKLIVVDYLQLMQGEGDNRTQQLGSISRALKAMAKEFGCPVIALSSLNRGVEQRPNKRPILSDLRESGDIESDADIVLMCYRDEYYNPDSPDAGTAELLIVKQRNGPTSDCRVAFVPECAMFADLNYSEYLARQRAPKIKEKGFD